MEMESVLIIGSIVLIFAVFSRKITVKLGTASMALFLGIGILLGPVSGWVDLSLAFSQSMASVALALIIFYGGYRVKVDKVKGVLLPSLLLSIVGTVLTAIGVAFVAMLVGFSFLQGLLIGSIICSTDTASVFTILSAHKVRLPVRCETVLDIESGSNDPFAYMMTIFTIALITQDRAMPITLFMVQQVVIGAGFALVISFVLSKLFDLIHFELNQFYPFLLVAIVFLIYGISTYLSGNGLLAVYIAGIVFRNNTKHNEQINMNMFFDSLSWVLHSLLFVLMGVLVKFNVSIIPVALLIGVILMFVIRPLIVILLLSFSSFKFKEKLVIGFIGIRGAGAIVFATYALIIEEAYVHDLYNIVFFIILLSLLTHEKLIHFIVAKLKINELN